MTELERLEKEVVLAATLFFHGSGDADEKLATLTDAVDALDAQRLITPASNDEILLHALKGCGCTVDLTWCTACVNSFVRKARDGRL